MPIKEKIEYGDFQTPEDLAFRVSTFIKKSFPNPSVIVEPTCGTGSFIKASLSVFTGNIKYYGFDINKKYINTLKETLRNENCFLEVSDFFEKDWKQFQGNRMKN